MLSDVIYNDWKNKTKAAKTVVILRCQWYGNFSVSGGLLRCDVLVDAIHHLVIVTTTRELYVEEAPEEFVVRAYDDQGGYFFSFIFSVW